MQTTQSMGPAQLETVVRRFSKEYISALEEGRAIDDFKQYVIKDTDMQLLDRINEILETQGEIVIKKSDLRVEDRYETCEVRYERFINWQPIVRCKDCKFYYDELCYQWAIPRMVEPMDFCNKGEKVCLESKNGMLRDGSMPSEECETQ